MPRVASRRGAGTPSEALRELAGSDRAVVLACCLGHRRSLPSLPRTAAGAGGPAAGGLERCPSSASAAGESVSYSARKDETQAEIVDAIRKAGASVEVLEPARLGGLPDLLVGFRGRNVLIEAKADDGDLSIEQQVWHGCWRGEKPHVVRSAYEALIAIGAQVRLPAREARVQRVAKLGIKTRGPRLVSSRRDG